MCCLFWGESESQDGATSVQLSERGGWGWTAPRGSQHHLLTGWEENGAVWLNDLLLQLPLLQHTIGSASHHSLPSSPGLEGRDLPHPTPPPTAALRTPQKRSEKAQAGSGVAVCRAANPLLQARSAELGKGGSGGERSGPHCGVSTSTWGCVRKAALSSSGANGGSERGAVWDGWMDGRGGDERHAA